MLLILFSSGAKDYYGKPLREICLAKESEKLLMAEVQLQLLINSLLEENNSNERKFINSSNSIARITDRSNRFV